MQRLRTTFARGEATRYITHLDLMRFWERAFRRAGLPVALTQGFHPHQRFALAAPLPVGVTGEAELMDVFLDPRVEPAAYLRRLTAQMVPGLDVRAVEEVAPEGPSLQALLRYADYRVVVETDRSAPELQEAIAGLLALPALEWEHTRDGEVRRYDLRRQVESIELEQVAAGRAALRMRLQTGSAGAGRPEQVSRALGFDEHPLSLHRIRLILADAPGQLLSQPTPSRGRRP